MLTVVMLAEHIRSLNYRLILTAKPLMSLGKYTHYNMYYNRHNNSQYNLLNKECTRQDKIHMHTT